MLNLIGLEFNWATNVKKTSSELLLLPKVGLFSSWPPCISMRFGFNKPQCHRKAHRKGKTESTEFHS